MINMINIKEISAKLAFNDDQRLEFYRQLASFLAAGLPISDLLTELYNEYKKSNPNDYRITIIQDILNGFNSGKTFAEAMEKWSPRSELMLLKAGEDAGALPETLIKVIATTNYTIDMKKAIKKELQYPAGLILAAFALMYFFSANIMPSLAGAKDPNEWGPSPKALYDFSLFMENYWFIPLGGIGALVFIINFTLPRVTGKVRSFLDKFPPWSTYRSTQSSVFLISISAMMNTGIPIINAIEMLIDMATPYTRSKLLITLQRSNAGRDIGESLNTDFLDTETGMNISIYGRLSSLNETLERVGVAAIEQTVGNIAKAAGVVKNIALLGIGGYLIWVITANQEILSSIAG